MPHKVNTCLHVIPVCCETYTCRVRTLAKPAYKQLFCSPASEDNICIRSDRFSRLRDLMVSRHYLAITYSCLDAPGAPSGPRQVLHAACLPVSQEVMGISNHRLARLFKSHLGVPQSCCPVCCSMAHQTPSDLAKMFMQVACLKVMTLCA